MFAWLEHAVLMQPSRVALYHAVSRDSFANLDALRSGVSACPNDFSRRVCGFPLPILPGGAVPVPTGALVPNYCSIAD